MVQGALPTNLMRSPAPSEEEEKLLGMLLKTISRPIADGIGTTFHEKKILDELDGGNEQATWRNLPQKKQLLLVALCRLSTPLSNACLLPYLYFLVKSIISDPGHATAPQQISRLTGLLGRISSWANDHQHAVGPSIGRLWSQTYYPLWTDYQCCC
tara:strand:- start:1405 stop:1872 length:468 start_codon:yes stop_codon:yes gene_type:complete